MAHSGSKGLKKASGSQIGNLSKAISFGVVLLCLVAGFGFLRYAHFSFFSNPSLLISESLEMPYPVSQQGAFVLEFDQRMKKKSVEQSFEITPKLAYETSWKKNSFFIKPKEQLQEGILYYVTVTSEARNILGKPLKKNYTVSYKRGEDPRIVEIFPRERTLDPDQKLILIFSHPMVSETVVGKRVDPDFLELSPLMPGEWSWRDSKVLVFSPKDGFPLSTRISLQSVAPILTYDETPLKEKIQKEFETERLAFVPLEEQLLQTVRDPFRILFNQEINLKNIEKHFSVIQSNGKKSEGLKLVKNQDAATSYFIISEKPWSYNEQYTISFSDQLMPRVGNLGLGEGVHIQITTESLLEEAVFQYSESPEVITTNGKSIRLIMKEPVDEMKFQAALSFTPEIPFVLKKNGEKEFEVSFDMISQKRESLVMYISPTINSDTTKYLSGPLELQVKKMNALNLSITELPGSICITSNYPLERKSVVSSPEREWKLDKSYTDECGEVGAISYEFDKQLLPPSREIDLKVLAVDVFDQQLQEELLVKTPQLKSDDILLDSLHSTFYSSVSAPEDLTFRYTTSNVSRLYIQACKISSDLAMKIEGAYDEKWDQFSPSAEKCDRYKAFFTDLDPRWGKIEEHELNIKDVFDEVELGLFYVNISTPQFFDTDGKSLQARGVLNYTRWNLFSKRGASSLVWLTEKSQPVTNATINLYASDGSLLQSGRTDRQGLFALDKNRIKYEYIVAKKGEEELIFNVFNSEGLEPARYSVPFNSEENPYRYQFFVESLKNDERSVRGVFILKQLEDTKLVPAKINGANVTLYDENEQLIGRRFSSFDDFGNLFFQIPLSHSLLDGRYQLGVCLGLHEGVCHGTYLWTTLLKGYPQEERGVVPLNPGKNPQRNIVIEDDQPIEVNKEITIKFTGMTPKKPALVTVERDTIFYKKIFTPDGTEESIRVPITDEMDPEVVVSLAQFDDQKLLYDLKHLQVSTKNKVLTFDVVKGDWLKEKSKVQDFSEIIVEMEDDQMIDQDILLNSFFPRLGTSVITGALTELELPQVKGETSFAQPVLTPGLVMVDGRIVKEKALGSKTYYLIAHDKLGHFGGVSVSQKREEKTLGIKLQSPDFLRDGDQFILDVSLVNNSNNLKNVQLRTKSEGLIFPQGESILLGLAPQNETPVRVPTRFSALPGQKIVPLQIELITSNVLEAELGKELFVMGGRSLDFPSRVLPHETTTGSAQLELSTEGAGSWNSRFILSATPLSYVLESIQNMLQKESLSFDESVFKRIVESNYSQLMKESWEQNQMLKHLSEKRDSVENLLYYLESRQKNDGGWSDYAEENESDPILSSWMAKSLSSLEQSRYKLNDLMRRRVINYLKGELDVRVNERIRTQTKIEDVPDDEVFEEMQILNGLSSLNPSGISYANTWYNNAEILSNHSLVLLLLTLEDYRDAGVSGMNFKIEEVIQLLKGRQQELQQQTWLPGDKHQELASDFLTTSWYLDALVRQASARNDIPSIITWLTRNKYQQKYQSPKDQFSFLQAMASYLRIYQEQFNAEKITVQLTGGSEKTFEMIPNQPFQSFFVEQVFTIEDELVDINTLQVSTDKEQPLFIEANWKKLGSSKKAVNNGISLYQEFDSTESKRGNKVKGTISIITPKALKDVVVTHPIISAAVQLPQDEESSLWKIKSFGTDEKWYLFPELPAGETIIPFEWELKYAGIFTAPQVQAYVISQPKTLSTSNTVHFEIRNE